MAAAKQPRLPKQQLAPKLASSNNVIEAPQQLPWPSNDGMTCKSNSSNSGRYHSRAKERTSEMRSSRNNLKQARVNLGYIGLSELRSNQSSNVVTTAEPAG